MPTFKQLSQKHPEWDGPYWRRCRALYAGGKRLLNDRAVMNDIFPKHLAEKPHVYEERCKRAYYIPYAGEIIDMITSALFSEDLKMEAEPEPDPWYDDWAKDVSPPGGQKQTLQRFLKEQVTTALLCRRAWTLVDLPSIDDAINDSLARNTPPTIQAPPGSLAEQEQMGMLNAYACPLDPDAVWDWETDRDGRLLWVLVHYTTARRASLEGSRDVVTEQWMHYTSVGWERYEISYPRNKPPMDSEEVPRVAQGPHSFGRVPVIPLELTDGLWAMGKIESIAVAHFNKRNALSWAQYKALFPVMTHFAGPPDTMNPITEDPDRAVNQTIGQGHVVQLGDKDRLEYIGPDSGPYTVAQADLAILRDEMHRVVHQMAMSVDNSAAALQRSAESKQVDQSSTCVVLREFGKIVREHAIELHEVAQVGRQDPKVAAWSASGMDSYSDASVDAVVAQAQTMEIVSIPSATFQREWKYLVAKRVLGDVVEEDTLDLIRDELEDNITNEQFVAPTPMEQFEAEQENAAADREIAAATKTPAEEKPGESAKPSGKPASGSAKPAPKASKKTAKK